MTAPAQPLFDYLSASAHARALRSLDLGHGRAMAIWRNDDDRMSYPDPLGHTVSLYLQGGHATRRLDAGQVSGFPGAVTVMPQGCASDWEIGGPMTFAHVYLPDRELRRAYAETFDRDARLMALPEVTFEAVPALAAPMRAAAQAALDGDALGAEAAATELVARLFVEVAGRPRAPLRGGLSPLARARLREAIEAGLDGPLRLESLAAVAGLSAFHFLRCFAQSFGVPPNMWIQHRRIERAKTLLREGRAVAEVAAACGFSSQSHLTRAFKALTGATPAAWRAGL